MTSIFRCYPLCFAFLLLGCGLRRLDVQTQYFTHESLASFHVGTPDPMLDEPTIGQRLLIQWSLSKEEIMNGDVYLHLIVRFRNHIEEKIEIPIRTTSNHYVYTLKNKKYEETGGILTYYVEIKRQDLVLATWKHPLWVPLIQINTRNFPQCQSNE